MTAWILLLQALDGVTIERTARITETDLLGESREIRCRQRLTLAEGRLRIEDLTFGTVTVVRADQGRVWTADPFLKLVHGGAAEAPPLERVRSARESARGGPEEERLTALLESFGSYDADPEVRVEAREGERTVTAGGRVVARVTLEPGVPGNHYRVLAAAGALHPRVGAALAGLEGTPMRGEERYALLGRSRVVQFEVTSVRRGAVAAGLFDPPAGYAAAAKP